MKRGAGLILPLFSLRSRRDWGIGEIGDLPAAAELARKAGFSWLQVLPPQELGGAETSPYGARSAFAIDPVYLSMSELPGMTLAILQDILGAAGVRELAELRSEFRVQYAAVRALKRRVLNVWATDFIRGPLRTDAAWSTEFDVFRASERSWLPSFSAYVARWNAHAGHGWQTWSRDAELHDYAAAELHEQVLQFIARRQWRSAREKLQGVRLMGDVPFIVGTESADVWSRQAEFRRDVSLGCPPDPFAAEGQDWSLPAYDFAAMATNDFEFLRARTRAARQLFDAFRLDHVVGYFRMWLWRQGPDGVRHGGFDSDDLKHQATRGQQLLRIMQSESGADALIAEDLGTVPDFVRETLAELQIPGYKIVPWERDERSSMRDPRGYAPLSVAAFSTHDTQPIGAWWNDFSEAERQDLLALAAPNAPVPTASAALSVEARHDALLRLLASAGSELILLQFEELLGRSGRINVPGTVTAQNWSLRLHQPIEDLMRDPVTVARLVKMHRILVETARA